MSFRAFLFILFAGTALSWATLLSVIFFVNPYQAGFVGLLAFYLSAFIACLGTLSLLGTIWRVIVRRRHETSFREVRIAFRHALLLSAFSVVVLVLSAQNWLNWAVFFFLLAALGVIEYLLLLIDEGRRG
ncbi:MAG: hypothetical protein U0487_00025 [Patescibacteria group bacterium]